MHIALCGASDAELLHLSLALQNMLNQSLHGTVSVAVFDPLSKTSGGDSVQPEGGTEAQPSYGLVFLMGLETPCGPTQHIDQHIRLALERDGLGYVVLYGAPEERVIQALALVDKHRLAAHSAAAKKPGEKPKPWTWACNSCGDAVCEQRLLSGLLASRAEG